MQDPTKYLEEFICTFKGSLDPRLWLKLIVEETEELRAERAYGNKLEGLKEAADVVYVLAGLATVTHSSSIQHLLGEEEWEEFAKTVTDAIEEVEAFLEQFDITEATLNKAFERVHESNMSKLGADGKPIFREDGKVLKGKNYKAPDLQDLVK